MDKSVISLNEVEITFETNSAAAAGKVKTYHRPLQMSITAVHMYSVLWLMQAKVLPIKLYTRIKISQMAS